MKFLKKICKKELDIINADRETEEQELGWPNTTPIDKNDPYWLFNNNININGTPYRKEEVSTGKWQWVIDDEKLNIKNEYYNRKNKLAMALQTRIITEDEMQEVMNYGIGLFIGDMVPYQEIDKQKQFNEAICQQYRLRAIANMSTQQEAEG